MSETNFIISCRNQWVTAQAPDEFVYCMLQVLENGEWYAGSKIGVAACKKYTERLGYDFAIVYSASHIDAAIKWLLKNNVIRDRTKSEYTSMFDKKKTTWKVYARGVNFDKWVRMFEDFGQFPEQRKMNYKTEALIRQNAIDGALKKLEEGDTQAAIDCLKYGYIVGMFQNPLHPFGVLDAAIG